VVTLRYRGKEYRIEPKGTLEKALRALGILPETVIALKDGMVIPLSHRLSPGEEIELWDVVSGG